LEIKVVPIEAVIFDLDGTLANFNLDYKALRAEVRSYLMRTGVPASVLNVNENIFEMLNKTEIYIKNKSKSKEAFNEVRTQALNIAEKYETEAASSTSLLPGAVETLQELEQMKIKVGICTTSGEKAVKYILQRFKINKYFNTVISRDKVKYVKPNTEQYELSLKIMNTKPQNTIIVGDSIVDMQSSKETKAISIGLTTGISTKEQLSKNGANYIITALTDLPILIKKINNN
jgi:HAD superfamily hydrolase (TIGR01549 family)